MTTLPRNKTMGFYLHMIVIVTTGIRLLVTHSYTSYHIREQTSSKACASVYDFHDQVALVDRIACVAQSLISSQDQGHYHSPSCTTTRLI